MADAALSAPCTAIPRQPNATAAPEFPGVVAMWTEGDGVTTLCPTVEANKICAEGYVADATTEYVNWGALIGLQLKPPSGPAWDATAAGVTRVGFDVELASSDHRVRVQLTQADDPRIELLTFPGDYRDGACSTSKSSCNYEHNPFIWGGSYSQNLKETRAGTVLEFAKFTLPGWTKVPALNALGQFTVAGSPVDAREQVVDASQLASLQFLVVPEPGRPGPYRFCISDLRWLKADSAAEAP